MKDNIFSSRVDREDSINNYHDDAFRTMDTASTSNKGWSKGEKKQCGSKDYSANTNNFSESEMANTMNEINSRTDKNSCGCGSKNKSASSSKSNSNIANDNINSSSKNQYNNDLSNQSYGADDSDDIILEVIEFEAIGYDNGIGDDNTNGYTSSTDLEQGSEYLNSDSNKSVNRNSSNSINNSNSNSNNNLNNSSSSNNQSSTRKNNKKSQCEF